MLASNSFVEVYKFIVTKHPSILEILEFLGDDSHVQLLRTLPIQECYGLHKCPLGLVVLDLSSCILVFGMYPGWSSGSSFIFMYCLNDVLVMCLSTAAWKTRSWEDKRKIICNFVAV